MEEQDEREEAGRVVREAERLTLTKPLASDRGGHMCKHAEAMRSVAQDESRDE